MTWGEKKKKDEDDWGGKEKILKKSDRKLQRGRGGSMTPWNLRNKETKKDNAIRGTRRRGATFFMNRGGKARKTTTRAKARKELCRQRG